MTFPTLPPVDVYILLKPVSYFEKSDLWDIELDNRGNFVWLETSEKYDKILGIVKFGYSVHSTIYHEILQHRIMPANIKDGEIGIYEIEQDNQMYFYDLLPDMIERVMTKETNPEYFV